MALLGGMGGGGKSQREGMCVGIWLIHFAVQQRLTQHCNAIILQLKKNQVQIGHSRIRKGQEE